MDGFNARYVTWSTRTGVWVIVLVVCAIKRMTLYDSNNFTAVEVFNTEMLHHNGYAMKTSAKWMFAFLNDVLKAIQQTDQVSFPQGQSAKKKNANHVVITSFEKQSPLRTLRSLLAGFANYRGYTGALFPNCYI